MDEVAYRQALATTPLHIVRLKKTVLTNGAACSKAEKHNIAELEIIVCKDVEADERCIGLCDLLRHNFTFALGKLHIDGPLPRAQEMRMKCGRLKGLQF